VYGIGRGPIVSAVLGRAVEMERRAALPSGNDAFAKLVFVDLRRDEIVGYEALTRFTDGTNP